jgi:hypothetical protein
MLAYRDVRPGLRVKRIEAERGGEQVEDIGRVGCIIEPTHYNNIAHTMSVQYEATKTQPEKVDGCCIPYEFKLEPAESTPWKLLFLMGSFVSKLPITFEIKKHRSWMRV